MKGDSFLSLCAENFNAMTPTFSKPRPRATPSLVILLGCLLAKLTTSLSKSRSATISLCILINANELSLFSVAKVRFQQLKLLLFLSISHVVTGSVQAMTRSVKMCSENLFSFL